jgi:hypothetical protein
MPPDNIAPLITAAHHRHELTRAKAIQALRELDHAGTPVTFEAVARTAGVSRSWLYSQNDIRREIERLRDTTKRAPSPPIPPQPADLRRLPAAATDRSHRAQPPTLRGKRTAPPTTRARPR